MPSASLHDLAKGFARQLSDLTSAFVDGSTPFVVQNAGTKIWVSPANPLVLSTGGRTLLNLRIGYRCMLDHTGRYLVVDESWIKVRGGPHPKGDPLFRYEYDRALPDDLPAAHVHVHAHRDHLVMAMALAAEAGAPRRVTRHDDFTGGARMPALHFPVGGHRFRPGLEDVLQMLHTEFGVDVGPDWSDVLLAARARYRRDQTGTAVRDCPVEAVRVLRELGYVVEEPMVGPSPDRIDRLHAF